MARRSEIDLNPFRKGYVHVARGEVRVNGETLQAGDAAFLQDEARLVVIDQGASGRGAGV